MIKRHLKIFTIILLFSLIISTIISINIVLAHPGRTDKYGGHYDTKTGSYHYHNSGSDTSYNMDYSSSNNGESGSIKIDSETGKLIFPPLEEYVKAIDRTELEGLYVENMNYYQGEVKRLEGNVSDLENEISSLKADNDKLKQENTYKNNEIKSNNAQIQALKESTNKLQEQIYYLGVILIVLLVLSTFLFIRKLYKDKKLKQGV